MQQAVITATRLTNQRIHNPDAGGVADVVRWMGAIQAQDYLGALWAIGLRMKTGTEQLVEAALANRTIVRSWPMRGTLHFVCPEDLHWMLKLLTPRVLVRSAYHYRQAELDKSVFNRCARIFEKSLVGNNQLTRPELYDLLENARISTASQRGLHILAHLAQTGLICFGPRKGKQQTFVLLDEWVREKNELSKEESLAECARRYFTSHGPATDEDFAWWSGLTLAESRKGLEMIHIELISEVFDDRKFWMKSGTVTNKPVGEVFLLPSYDEYTVGYKDRSAFLEDLHKARARNGIFNPVVIKSGKISGTWSRSIGKKNVNIVIDNFNALPIASTNKARIKYGKFMATPVIASLKE